MLTDRYRVSRWTAVLLLGMGSLAYATDHTWTGGSDPATGDFENVGNWSLAVPDDSTSNDIAVFSGTPTSNQPTLSTDRSINGLVFSTSSGGWTLGGSPNKLTIGNSGIDASGQSSGTNTISANLSMSNNHTWKVGAGGKLIVSGILGGTNARTLTIGTSGNTGTVELSGSNGYAGAMVVAFGTLEMNSSGTATTASVTVDSGATLRLAGSSGNQIGASVTVNGTFDLNGKSESISTLSGNTGTVTNTAASTTSTLTLTVNGAMSYGGTIEDGTGPTAGKVAISLEKNSRTFSGINTYSGGTNAANASFILGSDSAAGTGTISVSNSTVRASDATDRDLVNAVSFGKTTTFGSAETGKLKFGSLTIVGSQGSNNLTLTTAVDTTFTSMDLTQDNSMTVASTGGRLIVTGNLTRSDHFADVTVSGVFAVGGTVASDGPTVALSGGGMFGRNGTLAAALDTNASVVWANNHAGGLYAFGLNPAWGHAANNLTVDFGGNGSSTGAAIQWNGTGSSFVSSGQVLLLGNSISNGTVTIQNDIHLNNIAQTVQVTAGASNTGGGNDAVLSGKLTSGGLIKAGTGRLSLTNITNDYSGGTTVSEGTLAVSGTLGTGNVTVADGAILELDVNSAISDLATLDIAARDGTGNDKVLLDFTGQEAVGALILGGVNMAPGVYDANTHGSFFSGTGTILVPEPGSLAFVALAAGAVLARRRVRGDRCTGNGR